MAGIIISFSLVFAMDPGRKAAEAVSGTDPQINISENQITSYSYNPHGKQDPFQPFIIEEEKSKKEKAEILSPLQKLDILQFKLVGICGNDKHRVAAVEDGGGKFYLLFHGTYIGQNDAKVVKILTDSIIVEEKVQTGRGKSKLRQIILKLHNDEG